MTRRRRFWAISVDSSERTLLQSLLPWAADPVCGISNGDAGRLPVDPYLVRPAGSVVGLRQLPHQDPIRHRQRVVCAWHL